MRKEQTLYAQLVRTRDEPIPALQDEPGVVGVLSLVNRDTGDAMMIVLLQSAEQARRALGENCTLWEVTVRV